MPVFEDLPHRVRTLILGKLTLEIMHGGCGDIAELAKRRDQTIAMVWRDICRKAGQPVCTVPRHIELAIVDGGKGRGP
jgi:hypothetical protein